MTEDPAPYRPATEYDRFRKHREERASKDNRTREPPPPPQIKIDANTRHGEDEDICTLRTKEGFCKESETKRSEGLFHCFNGLNYGGCGVYLKHRRQK